MNHVKNERRGRLKSESLDELMRLRINGPRVLRYFPAAKYAKAWIEAGHMRTDDSSGRKRKHTEIEDPNEDDSNSSEDDEESNVEILESEGKFDFLDSALF